MHIRFQKTLILKVGLSILFIVIATTLILTLITQGRDNGDAMRRTVGFDSFADFFLSSIGGIVVGLILALALILLMRLVFFSQKFRGPVNALREQLHQIENGDFRLRPYRAVDETRDALFDDVRAVQQAMEKRFLMIKCAIGHLDDVRHRITQYGIDSSFGRDRYEEQLQILKTITGEIQEALHGMKFSINENLSTVLVVGGGGREHALCRGLAASRHIHKIYAVPGNPGIAEVAECVSLSLAPPFTELIAFAKEHAVGLVVVGPEQPLVDGLADACRASGIPVFGPDARGARIEGSKSYAKTLMQRYGIPTAAFREFAGYEEAAAWVRANPGPYVLKADGLAAGKGVHITADPEEAVRVLHEFMVERCFGESGTRVVIEEFMRGEEASVLALLDNETVLPLVAAQDHKAVGDGDTGPNTGGMGAYAPAPAVTPALSREIEKRILEPMRAAFVKEGIDYRGVLYAGLMLTETGPRVVEFNCRFGDPETQAVLPLLKTDLAELLWATATGSLHCKKVEYHPGSAVCVVTAAEGYPGPYRKDEEIRGLETLPEGCVAYHAGTRRDEAGILRTSGGRVLGVTAVRPTLREAISMAYAGVRAVSYAGMHWRSDIGARGLARLQKK